MLVVAGVAGFGVMVYTGVMLSTLKAHAFWATPALPVLFTVSALSTACAAIALSLGGALQLEGVALLLASSFTRSCTRSTSCSSWPRSSCCS